MKAIPLLDHSFVAAEKQHELNLMVKLSAPKSAATSRRPLNLCLVIDRSGSMAGEKLERTKDAMRLLITHLSGDDLLSIVTFESRVETLLEPTPVKDKDALKAAVSSIQSGGSTNLSGGWMAGVELLAGKADGKRLNRILMLTDGQANAGIVEPEQLTSLGASAHKKNDIVTTTLGFGSDFNEDLLVAIAKAAGGKFYFIESAESAPAVFREELEGLLSLVAQNIELKVTMLDPVKMMKQWTGYPAKQKGDAVTFALGDAYAEEEKNVLLALLVPGLKELGERAVAEVVLKYAEVTAKAVTSRKLSFPVMVNITDEETAKSAPLEMEVVQELSLQMAAEARRKAIEQADKGDVAGAQNMLRETRACLGTMPSCGMSPVLEEMSALEAEEAHLQERQYTSEMRKQMTSTVYNLASSQRTKLSRERQRRAQPKDPSQQA